MRVVHLCHVPLPPQHPDHERLFIYPGRWVVNLAMAQKAHSSIDPVLVTMVPGASRDFECEVDGIPVCFVQVPQRFRSATLFELERRKLANVVRSIHPELVHAHGTEESFVLAAQSTRLPYVVTAQGLFSQINSILPPRLISRARIQEFLERRALNRSKDIIAKSDYVADWIQSQYPRIKIHRIPNTFHPSLLAIHSIPKAPDSIVFVGMISPRKGLDVLADALEEQAEKLKTDNVPNSKVEPNLSPNDNFSAIRPILPSLHIVGNSGEGRGEYDRMILARLRRILGDRLVLHGIVTSAEAVKIVSECEILVAPSLEEMFGNQVIEALLVGTWPVVSSRTAMEENVLRMGAGNVFENGNPEALSASIRDAFDSISLWDHIETRRRVVEWMGPQSVAKMHEALYQQLL